MPTATQTPVSDKRSASARQNGAKSKGPVTAEGKAKSSQNALKHGLSAAKFLALPEDEADAYENFFDYMLEDLAPEGAEQEFYAARMIETMWRLRRIPSLEARFADPDPKAPRSQVGPQLNGGWLIHFGDLARYESSLERTLEKNRRALRQLQNEPKRNQPEPPLGLRSLAGALESVEGGKVAHTSKPDETPPKSEHETSVQNEPKPQSGAPSRGSDDRAESREGGGGGKIDIQVSEPPAFEPFTRSELEEDPADLRTIDLVTYDRRQLPLSQQRTLELVDFWLTSHPGSNQEEALEAIDPFHYGKSQNEPNKKGPEPTTRDL